MSLMWEFAQIINGHMVLGIPNLLRWVPEKIYEGKSFANVFQESVGISEVGKR